MHCLAEKIYLLSVAIVLSVTCKNAIAESMCDLAMTSGAFNTSDYSNTSRLVLQKKDSACRSEYNSLAEAHTAAQKSGASIGYGPFSFGASDAKQTSSGKYSIADSRFCKASSEDIDSFTTTRAKQQVTDLAFQAWVECLGKIETNKLFVSYSTNANGSGMTGMIWRSLRNGAIGNITGIVSPNTDEANKSLLCMIGTTSVEINKVLNIQIDKSKIAIACNKQPTSSVRLALTTSQDDQDWIALPSLAEQEQTRINEVAGAVNTLRQQIEIQKQQVDMRLVPVGSIVDWYRPKLDTTVPAGFQICDGAKVTDDQSVFAGQDTPNLIDTFIMGVGLDRVGEKGGRNSINLSHTHKLDYCGGAESTRFLQANAWARLNEVPNCAERATTTTTNVTDGALAQIDNRPKFVGLLKIMRIR